MVLNAITTSASQAIPQIDLLPSISQFLQTILGLAGVNTPDTLFNLLARATADSPGLAAAAYVNALSNTSVSTHTGCCWQLSHNGVFAL